MLEDRGALGEEGFVLPRAPGRLMARSTSVIGIESVPPRHWAVLLKLTLEVVANLGEAHRVGEKRNRSRRIAVEPSRLLTTCWSG